MKITSKLRVANTISSKDICIYLIIPSILIVSIPKMAVNDNQNVGLLSIIYNLFKKKDQAAPILPLDVQDSPRRNQNKVLLSTIFNLFKKSTESQPTSSPTLNTQVHSPHNGLIPPYSFPRGYIPDESDDSESDEPRVIRRGGLRPYRRPYIPDESEDPDFDYDYFYDEPFYEPVRQGFSAEQIDLVPKVVIKDEMVNEEGESMCSICIGDFVAEEMVNQLNCNHKFHLPCLGQWLLIHRTCPNCRQPVQL